MAYKTHSYHPKHGMREINSQAAHQELLKSDKLWRDSPYTEEELEKMKLPSRLVGGRFAKPKKPKRNDFKGSGSDVKFLEAMKQYSEDMQKFETQPPESPEEEDED